MRGQATSHTPPPVGMCNHAGGPVKSRWRETPRLLRHFAQPNLPSRLLLRNAVAERVWLERLYRVPVTADFHGRLTLRPHRLLTGYIRLFRPARNGFRALHPCTTSASAMFSSIILPTSKTMTLLQWDRTVYVALAGGATRAVFDEELPQLFGCGDWTRTSNLRLMRPTSYHCSTPRYKKMHPHHRGCNCLTVLGFPAHHLSLTVSDFR